MIADFPLCVKRDFFAKFNFKIEMKMSRNFYSAKKFLKADSVNRFFS